jgi:hypothetical protein
MLSAVAEGQRRFGRGKQKGRVDVLGTIAAHGGTGCCFEEVVSCVYGVQRDRTESLDGMFRRVDMMFGGGHGGRAGRERVCLWEDTEKRMHVQLVGDTDQHDGTVMTMTELVVAMVSERGDPWLRKHRFCMTGANIRQKYRTEGDPDMVVWAKVDVPVGPPESASATFLADVKRIVTAFFGKTCNSVYAMYETQEAKADFLGHGGSLRAASHFFSEKYNKHRRSYCLWLVNKLCDDAPQILQMIRDTGTDRDVTMAAGRFGVRAAEMAATQARKNKTGTSSGSGKARAYSGDIDWNEVAWQGHIPGIGERTSYWEVGQKGGMVACCPCEGSEIRGTSCGTQWLMRTKLQAHMSLVHNAETAPGMPRV